MSARYIVGDVFDVLATLEPDSVDLVFSSPPFLALRSYLPADHPDKGKEIGSEATPADFLDTLLDVVEACDAVLAPHGTLVFELGDTFSGSGSPGGDYNDGGMRAGQPRTTYSGSRSRRDEKHARGGDDNYMRVYAAGKRDGMEPYKGWPPSKSLCFIPTLFAASLAYGYNMLRPERTTPRWRVRNLVVWARPNPPVGALGDKFRPATSYLTVATKSRTRYFDLDAVRHAPLNGLDPSRPVGNGLYRGHPAGEQTGYPDRVSNPAGAPPLDYFIDEDAWADVFIDDVWEIPTAPYKGSHYATFPPALVVKPVKAMCPEKVCRVCGEPSRRIAQTVNAVGHAVGRASWRTEAGTDGIGAGHSGEITVDANDASVPDHAERVTLGWTDCGHDDYRPGVVLDPFAGSGTTLSVATGHGREAIGIDLDARNADLALDRVGPMFLTVEHLHTEGAA